MKGIAVKIYDILHSVEPLAYYRPNSKVKVIMSIRSMGAIKKVGCGGPKQDKRRGIK